MAQVMKQRLGFARVGQALSFPHKNDVTAQEQSPTNLIVKSVSRYLGVLVGGKGLLVFVGLALDCARVQCGSHHARPRPYRALRGARMCIRAD